MLRMLVWTPFAFVLDALAIWLVWGWHGVAIGLPAVSVWRAAWLSALANVFLFRVTSTEVDHALDLAKDQRKSRIVFWTGRGVWLFGVLTIVGFAYVAHTLAK